MKTIYRVVLGKIIVSGFKLIVFSLEGIEEIKTKIRHQLKKN